MLKRIFDIYFSLIGLIALLPFFFIISLFIVFDSKGGVFFIQKRVGKDGILFNLYKFRTMYENQDENRLLTIGGNDTRVTNFGRIIRKYKMDELPQLYNVLRGDMSFVGPRPEVEKYVKAYNDKQREVLKVKPGITDYASLKYVNESELLAQYEAPEKEYIKKIMPEKLELNLQYIKKKSFFVDLQIIIKTIVQIFS